MIFEGLVTTHGADGRVNVAPQGPIVTGDFQALRLRPFPGSVTYANLKLTPCGVYHIVDDVLLLVQTALDLPHEPPRVVPAAVVAGSVLVDCCRWYEFEVETVDETGERPVFDVCVVHAGRYRDTAGFNRARHAVIEATIAASRLHLLGPEAVATELLRCRSPVKKTGGARETAAFELLVDYVKARSSEAAERLAIAHLP